MTQERVRIPAEGTVLISACLAGVACTHEALPKTRGWAVRLAAEGRAVPVCPEVAGGLGIPRAAAEIRGGSGGDVLEGRGRVVNADGRDVTEEYLAGARAALAAMRRSGASLAVLKARSPSCGCGRVYDGSFSGTLHDGDGVTAAVLRREGFQVANDEQVQDADGA